MTRMLQYRVDAPNQGVRLDRFLAAAQADLSRSALQRLIDNGEVRVNGQAARAALRLREGDHVSLVLPPPATSDLTPLEMPLNVVYEDRDLIVLDKPAGLVVHPGAGPATGTLVHALLHRYPEIAGVGGAGRPGIVHRLDKETSGLLMVARSQRAYRVLIETLRARSASRTYDALVWGEPRSGGGTVEGAIGRHPKDRKRMAVVTRGGKPARTRWQVEERFGIASLLSVGLETGRTHQIRVHLAEMGYPVLGDPTYKGRDKKLLSQPEPQRSLAIALLKCLPRQALHASKLALPHPVTGERLEWRSPWPADFAQAVELLRGRRAPFE